MFFSGNKQAVFLAKESAYRYHMVIGKYRHIESNIFVGTHSHTLCEYNIKTSNINSNIMWVQQTTYEFTHPSYYCIDIRISQGTKILYAF